MAVGYFGSLDHLKPRSVRMVVCVADVHVRAVTRLFLQRGLLRALAFEGIAFGLLALRLVLRRRAPRRLQLDGTQDAQPHVSLAASNSR